MLEHGGRLRRAAAEYQIPLADWLDLSTGINPETYPVPPLDLVVPTKSSRSKGRGRRERRTPALSAKESE